MLCKETELTIQTPMSLTTPIERAVTSATAHLHWLGMMKIKTNLASILRELSYQKSRAQKLTSKIWSLRMLSTFHRRPKRRSVSLPCHASTSNWSTSRQVMMIIALADHVALKVSLPAQLESIKLRCKICFVTVAKVQQTTTLLTTSSHLPLALIRTLRCL